MPAMELSSIPALPSSPSEASVSLSWSEIWVPSNCPSPWLDHRVFLPSNYCPLWDFDGKAFVILPVLPCVAEGGYSSQKHLSHRLCHHDTNHS